MFFGSGTLIVIHTFEVFKIFSRCGWPISLSKTKEHDASGIVICRRGAGKLGRGVGKRLTQQRIKSRRITQTALLSSVDSICIIQSRSRLKTPFINKFLLSAPSSFPYPPFSPRQQTAAVLAEYSHGRASSGA